MKPILARLVAAAVVLVGGIAIAQVAPGPGAGRPGGAAAFRKFQQDTFALRDELAAKQADLDDEYAQAKPDEARVAALEREIVDLRAKLRATANRAGVRPWGPHNGRGMMYGWAGGPGSCGCW